jgi:hypothetical protein
MAKAKPKLTDVSTKLHDLLFPLDSDERMKVVQSAFTLLGERVNGSFSGSDGGGVGEGSDDGALHGTEFKVGPKATRWMKQHQVTAGMIEEVFHFQSGAVEVIATEVPGNSKQAQSRNCYLLLGIQELLHVDSPTFQDNDAIALCKHMRCYDSPNHNKVRKELGLSGGKKDGFTLTAPCLRDAATLIKSMAPTE